MHSPQLTTTFAALGDPVRSAIVGRLVDGDATVNELAALFPISLQAVSKHIGVLERAGVVSRRREGKTRPVHLEPAALAAPADWLDAHRRRLETKYRRLDALLATQPRTRRTPARTEEH
jgi:DNA-binding transcriptional ArsR family regulator